MDAGDVTCLAARCFSHPWSEGLWRDELEREFAHVWGLRSDVGTLAALIDFWVVRDELHVLNLATDPRVRRLGLGRGLLEASLELGRSRGARHATLEVRRGNEAAIRLYRRSGFVTVGIRPGYYDDGEDALLMLHGLRSAPL